MKKKLIATEIVNNYTIECYTTYSTQPDIYADCKSELVTKLDVCIVLITKIRRDSKGNLHYCLEEPGASIYSTDKHLLNTIVWNFKHGRCTVEELNKVLGRPNCFDGKQAQWFKYEEA